MAGEFHLPKVAGLEQSRTENYHLPHLQGSCPSSQPFDGKSTSVFKEGDGGHEDCERTSGKPVRRREWPRTSAGVYTFLGGAFVSERKAYTSRTLTAGTSCYSFISSVPLSCLRRKFMKEHMKLSAPQGSPDNCLVSATNHLRDT